MKFLYSILIFFVLGLNTFLAQPNNKVEALRADYIAKRMNFSNAESEKFWPLYNEYNDKLVAIKRNLRQAFHKSNENMSEAEAEILCQLEMQSRQAELDVHKQYYEKIKAIIGAKKMVKLRAAEEDFKKEIVKILKERNE